MTTITSVWMRQQPLQIIRILRPPSQSYWKLWSRLQNYWIPPPRSNENAVNNVTVMQLLLATVIFEHHGHQHHRVILIPPCLSQNYLNDTYSFVVLWLPWPKLQSYVTSNLPTSQSSGKTTMIITVMWITRIALPCFLCPNTTTAELCKYKYHDHHRIMWVPPHPPSQSHLNIPPIPYHMYECDQCILKRHMNTTNITELCDQNQ